MNLDSEEKQELNDLYSGFNDYEHAYDFENAYFDKEFVQAVNRSSHGRRPVSNSTVASAKSILSSNKDVSTPNPFYLRSEMHTPTIKNFNQTPLNGQHGNSLHIGKRIGNLITNELGRPITAIRAAGYTSAKKSIFDKKNSSNSEEFSEDNLIQNVRLQENVVNKLLLESIMAFDEKDYKKSLEKAKEAGRKERAVSSFRTLHSINEQNLDLTLIVLLNLAQQYTANNMFNEALHSYHAIIKNKSFTNADRFKINIGNIYFCKKDYSKAIKYYRMAFDRIPKIQQRLRTKILNNIGITLIKLGKHEDALAAFEECSNASNDYNSAFNLILAAYCLNDSEKMREAFQRLVDLPLLVDDEIKNQSEQDILTIQIINDDILTKWEKQRKQTAERTILLAAKIISKSIANSFSEGYAWCVETIRQSAYASLAIELEMNKAIDYMKNGEIDLAVETLTAFNNKESKIASAALNNLSLISFMKDPNTLTEAIQYNKQALNLDCYNANALVNRGNIYYYLNGDSKLAQQCYKEALQIEATCVQAIYNLGLLSKEMGNLEEAKKYFYKLNEMLLNNVQVIIQLASIYELQNNLAQAIDLYTQANNLVPTDVSILLKLANIYEAEGDKAQAFQFYNDSYNFYPSNIEVIRWLGNHHLQAQFPEKAVSYFEEASLFEPNNIEWQLLIGTCYRRSGKFQEAIELYKEVNSRFPDNLDCLKFLVQLCKDLRMTAEEKEYSNKLKKLEKMNQLKTQRESDFNQIKRSFSASSQQQEVYLFGTRKTTPNSSRTISSRSNFTNSPINQRLDNDCKLSDKFYQKSSYRQNESDKSDNNSADLSLNDSISSNTIQSISNSYKNTVNLFENEIIDDLLPD